MAKRKRDYDNEFPSVTQCLDVLRKIGLENWFKYNTPEFIKAEGLKGRTIGTETHAAIENYITTGELKVDSEYPDEVLCALKSFVLFKKEHPEIKIQHSEMKLTSIKHSFNGTLDVIGEIDGEIIVGDWKTGAAKEEEKPSIYDEYKWQVATYTNLYNEAMNANVKRAFIVSLAKDKVAYNLEFIEEQEIKESFEEVFLPALRILNYKRRK